MKFIIVALAFVSAVLAADPPMRNEFDKLLVQTMMTNFAKMEYRLMELSHEITHLETTKSAIEQATIVAEIEMMIGTAEHGEKILAGELARKDLNILEQIDFESAQKIAQILVKDLKAAEVKVKAIKTH
uniref:Tyr p 5.02 allergen n=1 Tax=Tyrophagus putrescentiae TaxID=59818 RepID=B2GM94_TYRPU|nr:Tyr p 5.02 allergen [Tyrophagus putrescentiae]